MKTVVSDRFSYRRIQERLEVPGNLTIFENMHLLQEGNLEGAKLILDENLSIFKGSKGLQVVE